MQKLAAVVVLLCAVHASASAAWTTSTSYSVVGDGTPKSLINPSAPITGIPLSVTAGAVFMLDIAGTTDTDAGTGPRVFGLSIGGLASTSTPPIEAGDSIGTTTSKTFRAEYVIMCTAADHDNRDFSFRAWGIQHMNDEAYSRTWTMLPTTVTLTGVPALTSIGIVPLVTTPSTITVTSTSGYLVAV